MASYDELSADLVTCQAAITRAQAIQATTVRGKQFQNAELKGLYAERRALRQELNDAGGSGRMSSVGQCINPA